LVICRIVIALPRRATDLTDFGQTARPDRRGELAVTAEDPEPDEPQPDVALLPIEDAIDLHGFQPRDIPSVVEEYLAAAHERGLRELRLIHGRGIGFQRQRVRELLARHPLVERFADAPAYRGGWGATLVWLRDEPAGA
jgi:dsDNA-specific endonuclease/ATPase MutS2